MSVNATLYMDNMRVTIDRGGNSVWAAFHKAGTPTNTRCLVVFLSDRRPAELAAWEALADALAAQDATAEAESV